MGNVMANERKRNVAKLSQIAEKDCKCPDRCVSCDAKKLLKEWGKFQHHYEEADD